MAGHVAVSRAVADQLAMEYQSYGGCGLFEVCAVEQAMTLAQNAA